MLYEVITPKFYESDRIHIAGLIVSNYSFEHSHWNAKGSLSDWLKEHKVPGIFGIDTRELTKVLREKGCMLGKIEVEDETIEFNDPNKTNLVAKVSVITSYSIHYTKLYEVKVNC